MSRVILTLGRCGMGPILSNEELKNWGAFVTKRITDEWDSDVQRIDNKCGFEVTVDYRTACEVQTNTISAGCDDDERIVHEAVRDLWIDWVLINNRKLVVGEREVNRCTGMGKQHKRR